jgi:hypothetical protein
MNDDLEALAQELFGAAANIPRTYLRELKRYLDVATARLGLVVSSHERAVYWIDGNTLGVIGCTGVMEIDLTMRPITARISRLDYLTPIDITVSVAYDNHTGKVTDSGRRLSIGDPARPHIVLDASPGRFSADKRAQIEQFIDDLLAAVAGRASGSGSPAPAIY